jgi:hypothetical protein
MTMPVVPVNRTQRRQMMRAQGWRGSKAKRRYPNRSAHVGKTAEQLSDERKAAEAAQADHEARNRLRGRGLIVAPSAAEMDHLKATGQMEHDPRLVLPGER